MLKICITFDYELFFGKTNFTVNDVLITPTKQIMDILEKHNTKATFFCDVPMCIKHRKQGLNYIADLIESQIVNMVERGHDPQLHIHPFWYKAELINDEWKFNSDYYGLNSFEKESHGIEEIIIENKEFLTKLIRSHFNEYECISYRAGGFCIQPEKRILDALRKNGIFVDSSVCKRLYANTSSHCFNFCKAPKRYAWRFGINKGVLSEDKDGEFVEIPIGSEYTIPQKWIIVHSSPRLKRGMLKGQTSNDTDEKKSKIIQVYEKIKAFVYQGVMMSLDSSHYLALEKMIINYIKTYDCKNNDVYVSVIGHPKLFTECNFSNLDNFLSLVKNNYSDIITFITIKDAYKEMEERKNG